MKEDKERWNKRFSERPMEAPKPPEFVNDVVSQLRTGTVLDIASGDGAAGLFLAEKGFTVTAADISIVALDRLRRFAEERNISVTTCLVDLDKPESLMQAGSFDNIVITYFKPKPEYWPLLISLLNSGGKLLVSTFNIDHHIKNNFSRRFCLEEDELIQLNEQLILEHHSSVNRNGNFMDDYLFRKV